MADFIIAIGFIMALLSGWLLVQKLSRDFAIRHPEFGPPKEEGGGCGHSCLCSSSGSCKNKSNAGSSLKIDHTLHNQEGSRYGES
jgi:hypothetical protein